ncbi:MAG: hypothetical protein ACRD4E_05715 [Bryobacteraceae bacterium]
MRTAIIASTVIVLRQNTRLTDFWQCGKVTNHGSDSTKTRPVALSK